MVSNIIFCIFSQTKTTRQGRGSYFASIVIPLGSRIVGRQVPKPRCLSPAANSLYSRIAGRQVPKPRCLSPAANSLCSRIAGRQVPTPRCLSPAANSLYSRIAGRQVPKPRCLSPSRTGNLTKALETLHWCLPARWWT